jgi:hypothetical protein
MKSKVVKYLQKAQDELEKDIQDARSFDEQITNIDVEYLRDRIGDLIYELESIDNFETDSEDDTMFMDFEDEDDYNGDY